MDPIEKIVDKIRAFPIPAMGLAFLAGLLLGWLAIGWWIWPVSWTDADPWDLRAEHQERYVDLVAKGYAQARDAKQAKEALAGWDEETLADLLTTMQDQAPDSEARRQLADLALTLGLPRSEAIAPPGLRTSPAVPPLRSRLVAVFVTAGVALAVAVLVIVAISTRPWESAAKWAQRVQRAQAAEAPPLIPGRFVSVYARDRDDYADYFPIEAPDGQFLGECGLSIGCVLGRETPRQVTALEMVLFDSLDHCTETRMLMSRYAHENAALRQELVTRGGLIPAEPGTQVSVETNNLHMLATVTDVEYVDQEPAEGVFQRVVVDLDVRIKYLPTEKSEGGMQKEEF